jgi:hypothetical protein
VCFCVWFRIRVCVNCDVVIMDHRVRYLIFEFFFIIWFKSLSFNI